MTDIAPACNAMTPADAAAMAWRHLCRAVDMGFAGHALTWARIHARLSALVRQEAEEAPCAEPSTADGAPVFHLEKKESVSTDSRFDAPDTAVDDANRTPSDPSGHDP